MRNLAVKIRSRGAAAYPVADCVLLDARTVAVERCPHCGGRHVHGRPGRSRASAVRSAHCSSEGPRTRRRRWWWPAAYYVLRLRAGEVAA